MNKSAGANAGWRTKRLGEVCEIIMGQSPDGNSYNVTGEGVPLINGPVEFSQGAFGDTNRSKFTTEPTKLCRKNDLILCVRGSTTGRMNIAGFDACIGRGVAAIRALEYQPWINHFISSKRDDIHRLGTGATFPNVSGTMLSELMVPLPPLLEQQRVVGILDEAFDGIATAKANAEKNLQNSRALFESHLQFVFTQRGERWKMERLGALTHLARGHNPPKSKFSREPKPGYVRFYQIRDGGTDDYKVYVPDAPQLHKMKVDDIMMVAYRHIGRAFRGVEGAFNVALCKISNARRDLLDDDFLFHIIPSRYVKGELLKRSERSLIPSMSIEHLRELLIPLPPLREQHRLVEIIKSLSTETQRLQSVYQQKLAALDGLKKSLLHQAFTGAL